MNNNREGNRASLGRLGARLIFVVLIAALSCSAVWAQNTAQISGSVKDQTGAVLPGVEVTATQTATSATRSAVTDETGAYVLPNLPIGPYRLEAALPGFKTFAQTGIVLQVSGNPTVNVILEVGQVSDQIEVQADAALVETRSTGVGQVIDNQRVLELPLNGRNAVELIILSGAAVGGGAQATNRNYPTQSISVAGGNNNGLTYLLDGATHNDPFNNLNLPLPFPDALQEFKVETSAVPAQYGQHSAGAINAVTKSGTNSYHGDLFEFVRNGVFNSTDPYALKRDNLKRNQFGGVFGGPIKQNKLFFFGGYQGMYERSAPTDQRSFVPTPRMLAGDFSIVTSPACVSGGRSITLRTPFGPNNQISPSLFSIPALNMVKRLPAAQDECGLVQYGRRTNSDERIWLGKVDFTKSDKHSLFFRAQSAHLLQPTNYDGVNLLTTTEADYARRADSWVIGDTYLLGSGTVSSFHATLLRTVNVKTFQDLFTLTDLGVKNIYYPDALAKIPGVTVSGTGFAIHSDPGMPGNTNSTVGQFSEDLSLVRGPHQIGVGVNYIHSEMNNKKSSPARPRITFDATNTGLPLGDFLIGKPVSYGQGNMNAFYYRQHYVGSYVQDTWKATPRLTVSTGIRWEPFQAPWNKRGRVVYFDQAWFDQGLRSTVYTNAPSGFLFPGDQGIPESKTIGPDHWKRFAPRVGLAWDVQGNGLMTVRAAYGIYTDYPHFYQYGGYSDQPPWGAEVTLDSPGPFDDPWAGYPGGNPFPFTLSKDAIFPRFGTFVTIPRDIKMPYANQWNLSVQRQVGSDWLFAANYLGSNIIHNWINSEGNPAIYIPGNCVAGQYGLTAAGACSSTSNTQQRRKLYLQNPAQGQYIGNVVVADDGGTRNYQALLISIQKRRANGLTVQGNYTLSHCIEDRGSTPQFQNNGQQVKENRQLNRGNCDQDKRHNLNLSTVYETPQFGNRGLRLLATGWKVSGIVRLATGSPMTITPGTDRALTATGDQRVDYLGGDPYNADKTIDHWFNVSAFAPAGLGKYGTLGNNTLWGPGSIRIDAGLTRTFAVRENQTIEFRAEAFNAPNHFNPGNPNGTTTAGTQTAAFNSSNFGKVLASGAGGPRVIQLALKYVF